MQRFCTCKFQWLELETSISYIFILLSLLIIKYILKFEHG